MLNCKSWILIMLGAAAMASAGGPGLSGEAADLNLTQNAAPTPADHGAYFAPAMRFDADGGSLEVTFGIDEAARLTLHAFDSQGKLLAVLLDGNQAPGFHHLSLFSNRLQGYKGHVVFQLRNGHSVLGESRARPRDR